MNPIQNLIRILSRLPGLGPRSGQRLALHLIKNRHQALPSLIEALQMVQTSIQVCPQCFNWDTTAPCWICQNIKRDPHLICVIESVPDLWAFERSQVFKGLYHVLGGTLSAIDGITPDQLTIQSLINRIEKEKIDEIVLALNPTVSGQTTLYYLLECLRNHPIQITTLAQGIPMGGELDYLDDRTLALAFQSRNTLKVAS